MAKSSPVVSDIGCTRYDTFTSNGGNRHVRRHLCPDTQAWKHEKPGQLHCDVIYDGFIVVAGEPRKIQDGEEIAIERIPVKVRGDGNDDTVMRAA